MEATAAPRPVPVSPATTGWSPASPGALTEGLSAEQSDEDFDAAVDASIAPIVEAAPT